MVMEQTQIVLDLDFTYYKVLVARFGLSGGLRSSHYLIGSFLFEQRFSSSVDDNVCDSGRK